MPAAIDPIPGTDVDAQFDNAFTDGIAVAEISRFDLAQADADACCGDLVAYAGEPIGERFVAVLALISKQIYHGRICSLKATGGPVPRCQPQSSASNLYLT